MGSSSYISNLDGEVVQHIEYVPFGEVFLEEKNAKWNTSYLFTSKELDKETGMCYMSARYQDPKLGIFISVDPLAEKFKGLSSYTYAFNNPLNLIDPTGMGPEDPPTVWSKIKTYADYQWNTKIPNDLKKIGRELDNGWRMKLKDGFDFRSSLRNGESYHKVPKEKGTRNTQVVDITGIDILSTYVGLSTGTKTVSKSGKIVDVLSDFAKAVKSTPDGWTIGQNVGEMINQTTIEITNTFYSDNVNQVSGKRYVTERVSVTKDTTINLKDRQQVLLNQNKKMKKEENKNKESLSKTISITCFTSLIVLLFFSCKKEIKETKNVKEISKDNYLNFSTIEINFPDTVIINKDYKGFIVYKSLFDTLDLEKGKNRFINLYLRGSKNRTEYSDVKKIAHDTFGMYKEKIRFKVTFKEIGNNYLNGHIEDEVFIDYKGSDDKARNISKVSPFHKPVFVKEK